MHDTNQGMVPPDTCPPWCSQIHLESPHAEDQVHQSTPILVPGTARHALLPEYPPTPTEYLVMAAAPSGQHEPWVIVAESEGPTKVAYDCSTATRLLEALQGVLGEIGAPRRATP